MVDFGIVLTVRPTPLLASAKLFVRDEVSAVNVGLEVVMRDGEGSSPSSRGSGTGLCPIVDRRVEIPNSTKHGDCTRSREVELEEVCYHALAGKPVAVSAATSEVSGHPRLLNVLEVGSNQASEPRGLPPRIHGPTPLDPQGTIEEVNDRSTVIELKVSTRIVRIITVVTVQGG